MMQAGGTSGTAAGASWGSDATRGFGGGPTIMGSSSLSATHAARPRYGDGDREPETPLYVHLLALGLFCTLTVLSKPYWRPPVRERLLGPQKYDELARAMERTPAVLNAGRVRVQLELAKRLIRLGQAAAGAARAAEISAAGAGEERDGDTDSLIGVNTSTRSAAHSRKALGKIGPRAKHAKRLSDESVDETELPARPMAVEAVSEHMCDKSRAPGSAAPCGHAATHSSGGAAGGGSGGGDDDDDDDDDDDEVGITFSSIKRRCSPAAASVPMQPAEAATVPPQDQEEEVEEEWV